MEMHPLTDIQIDRGTATNQVLQWNDTTKRWEVTTTITDITLNSPVISGDFSWTGDSTWNLTGGSKTVNLDSDDFRFIDGGGLNWLVFDQFSGEIFLGNATLEQDVFFFGNLIIPDGGTIGTTSATPLGVDLITIDGTLGEVKIDGALGVTGLVTLDDNLLVDGGAIGITADLDLLQLSIGRFDINGVLVASSTSGHELRREVNSTGTDSQAINMFRILGSSSQNGDATSINWRMTDTANGTRNYGRIGYRRLADIDEGEMFITVANTGGSRIELFTLCNTGLNIIPNTRIGDTTVPTHGVLEVAGAGTIFFKETSTPTALTGFGAIYTKSDDSLYFQDGSGMEHLVHGSAFSNLWFHGASTSVTISSADLFFKIDTFENVGDEDDQGNAIGDVTAGNNDITIAASGEGVYEVAFGASITAAGAARTMVLAAGIEFGTPKVITAMTGNLVSPIVVTITGHPFSNGDMVNITDCTGNDAANGQWFVLSAATDTFALHNLDGLGASTGDGTYDASSGSVVICYSGEILAHRKVSQNDVGNVYSGGDLRLLSGDKVGVYVLNLDASTNLNIFQITLHINREDQ